MQSARYMRWALWVSGLLCLAMLLGFAVFLAPLKPGVVVLQLSFGSAAFTHVLQDWGPSGVELFRLHLRVDYVFMLCYGALGYLLATETELLASRSAQARRVVALLLPVAAAFDVVENLLHGKLIDLEASHPESMYRLAGAMASAKWALIALFVVLMVRAALRRKGQV